jgi:hypothetical protein
MRNEKYNTNPLHKYDGPEFEEFCISEGEYLPATRDRTPCMKCPLHNLCIAGFEEQVARIIKGENPSLTEGCNLNEEMLTKDQLFKGLTHEQIKFVLKNIPNL